MISRIHRFHGHNSVSRVRGSVLHSKHVSVRYAHNKRKSYRAAAVVSKKIDGRAVTRNRIRRRIYEIIRTSKIIDSLPIDIVVYAKTPDISTVSYDELSKEIIKSLKTAAIRTVSAST